MMNEIILNKQTEVKISLGVALAKVGQQSPGVPRSSEWPEAQGYSRWFRVLGLGGGRSSLKGTVRVL